MNESLWRRLHPVCVQGWNGSFINLVESCGVDVCQHERLRPGEIIFLHPLLGFFPKACSSVLVKCESQQRGCNEARWNVRPVLIFWAGTTIGSSELFHHYPGGLTASHTWSQVLTVTHMKAWRSSKPQWSLTKNLKLNFEHAASCNKNQIQSYYNLKCFVCGFVLTYDDLFSFFSTEYGIYKPNCELDNVFMSWGHDGKRSPTHRLQY